MRAYIYTRAYIIMTALEALRVADGLVIRTPLRQRLPRNRAVRVRVDLAPEVRDDELAV